MTMFIERSLPAGDRDDAPIMPARDPIADAFDRPALTDDVATLRLTRLTRHMADAQRHILESLRLLAEGRHCDFRVAMSGCAANLTEAAPLARLLASPPRDRRKE